MSIEPRSPQMLNETSVATTQEFEARPEDRSTSRAWQRRATDRALRPAKESNVDPRPERRRDADQRVDGDTVGAPALDPPDDRRRHTGLRTELPPASTGGVDGALDIRVRDGSHPLTKDRHVPFARAYLRGPSTGCVAPCQSIVRASLVARATATPGRVGWSPDRAWLSQAPRSGWPSPSPGPSASRRPDLEREPLERGPNAVPLEPFGGVSELVHARRRDTLAPDAVRDLAQPERPAQPVPDGRLHVVARPRSRLRDRQGIDPGDASANPAGSGGTWGSTSGSSRTKAIAWSWNWRWLLNRFVMAPDSCRRRWPRPPPRSAWRTGPTATRRSSSSRSRRRASDWIWRRRTVSAAWIYRLRASSGGRIERRRGHQFLLDIRTVCM